MLNEILAFIISLLGLFAGLSLRKIAKEEIKPGAKYFKIIREVLFVAILLWFFFFSKIDRTTIVISVILFVILDFGFKNYYAVFGLAFGIAPGFVLSALIFVYGLPAGSLIKKKAILKHSLSYLIFGVVGFLLRTFILQ